MFRRRSKKPGDAPVEPVTERADEAGAEPVDGSAADAGPWDAEDLPDDDIPRVDLGGLRIPAMPGVELRLETDPAGAVAAVLLVAGASTLQLGAFAAPRREGIWTEVRAELLASLVADGGVGDERQGSFGVELAAGVPGPQGRQPVRFVGIDGPRWFLRGAFTGPAATDPVQAAVLETALRDVVVARGGDPLPVRDPLPLVLPREVLQQQQDSRLDPDVDDAAGRSAPGVPERGPEISETR